MAIARNKALSARRTRTDAELDEAVARTVADPADNPDMVLERKDRGELVRQALINLSPKRRAIIDLVYYHEKSIDEVAQVLGVPSATVKDSHVLRPSKTGRID
jgi:RNA polymerase sigma-70 factor (ECF subfamily)